MPFQISCVHWFLHSETVSAESMFVIISCEWGRMSRSSNLSANVDTGGAGHWQISSCLVLVTAIDASRCCCWALPCYSVFLWKLKHVLLGIAITFLLFHKQKYFLFVSCSASQQWRANIPTVLIVEKLWIRLHNRLHSFPKYKTLLSLFSCEIQERISNCLRMFLTVRFFLHETHQQNGTTTRGQL